MSKPTRPTVPVTIDGTEYKLYFDFNAIADVEERLQARGIDVNLIAAKWHPLTATSTRALFAAALKKHHPTLTEEDVRELYGEADQSELIVAIGRGYRNFIPEEEEAKEGEDVQAVDPLTPDR